MTHELNQVRILLAKGLAEQAEMELRGRIAVDPDDSDSWVMLGVRFEDDQNFGQAATAFEEAVAAIDRSGRPGGFTHDESRLRLELSKAMDKEHGVATRIVAAERAAAVLKPGADPAWAAPEWDRYQDHLSCLTAAPFEDYLRIYLSLDPSSETELSADAAWYFRADGQLSESDRDVLQQLLSRVDRPGLRILEIGSAIGLGSTRLFGASAKKAGGELICIDPWDDIYGVTPRRVFDRNMTRFGLSGTVAALEMHSVTAADQIADQSVDLIFIDGDHRYAAVRDDIAIWKTKLRPNGIMCGDDCEGHVDDFNRADLERHKDDDIAPIVRIDEGPEKVHPGVILAVSEAFGEGFQVLGDPPSIWVADR